MINTYNGCINSFYEKYYNVLDQLNAKVGIRAPIALDLIAPAILSTVAFCPGFLLYAYDNDIEQKLIYNPNNCYADNCLFRNDY